MAHSIQNICDAWIKEIKIKTLNRRTQFDLSGNTVTLKIGTHRYNHASFVLIAIEYTDITFFSLPPHLPTPHTKRVMRERKRENNKNNRSLLYSATIKPT